MSQGSSGIILSLVNAFGAASLFLVAFYFVALWWLPARVSYDAGMVSFTYETGSSGGLGDPTLSTHIISMNLGGMVFSSVVLLIILTLPIWGALLLVRVGEGSSEEERTLRPR